jgi:hypothetical protein
MSAAEVARRASRANTPCSHLSRLDPPLAGGLRQLIDGYGVENAARLLQRMVAAEQARLRSRTAQLVEALELLAAGAYPDTVRQRLRGLVLG